MQRSTDRILTTHTGSLPRPSELIPLLFAHEEGSSDQAVLDRATAEAVTWAVGQQVQAGIDVLNDGEMGKMVYATYVKDHRDVALRDIIDLVFEARPNGISLEACNPRHAHEWQVFEEVKLPPGKVLIPGVIDSTNNYIEHPDLIAQRLRNYVRLVGQENVMASSDCGFGTAAGASVVDPKITWAKFQAMAEGARLASRSPALAAR